MKAENKLISSFSSTSKYNTAKDKSIENINLKVHTFAYLFFMGNKPVKRKFHLE